MKSSALVLLPLLGCSHAEPAPTAEASPTANAIASFDTVRAVLQSPRCVNCHPQGDQPLQGDEGWRDIALRWAGELLLHHDDEWRSSSSPVRAHVDRPTALSRWRLRWRLG